MGTDCSAVSGGSATSTGLAEVFRRFGPSYLCTHVLSPEQARVLRHIIDCRTPAMGGHAHSCDSCGHAWHAHNSCRDRPCPVCQGIQQRRWIEKRTERLVPTHHFHVVFTEPEALLYHPHLHCIVTGGGLTDDDGWVTCKKTFLFPVKVLGALFRGKFLAGLRALFDAGELRFVGTSAHLEHPVAFEALLADLRRQSWVVYAQKPFGSTHYLGLYTHRVAISYARILSIRDDAIVISTRKGQPDCRMAPDEFLRRFLLHTLPKGLNKIRHYGLYAASHVGCSFRSS